jgi:hypothetical protein
MPETPVKLRVPNACPRCDTLGMVALETTVTGDMVELVWWCKSCEYSWLVKRKDEAGA